MKATLGAKAELTGWRLHDFRRSFATALGETSFPEVIVDAVLNHRQSATRGGVLGTYQRSQRWPDQVRAMKTWGKILATAIERQEPRAANSIGVSNAAG
jgi:hypothetical protein